MRLNVSVSKKTGQSSCESRVVSVEVSVGVELEVDEGHLSDKGRLEQKIHLLATLVNGCVNRELGVDQTTLSAGPGGVPLMLPFPQGFSTIPTRRCPSIR